MNFNFFHKKLRAFSSINRLLHDMYNSCKSEFAAGSPHVSGAAGAATPVDKGVPEVGANV